MELKYIYFDIDKTNRKKLKEYLTEDNKLQIECDDFVNIMSRDTNTVIYDFKIQAIDFIKFYKFVLKHNIKCHIANSKFDDFWKELPYTNNVEIVEYLFDIDFTCFSPEMRSCIYDNFFDIFISKACKISDIDTVIFLLEKLFNDNHFKEYFENIFWIICKRGNEVIITKFYDILSINNNIHFNEYVFQYALGQIIKSGNVNAVHIFIDRYPKILTYLGSDFKYLIRKALKFDYVDIAEFLISTERNLNFINDDDVIKYMEWNCVNAVEFLINKLQIDDNKLDIFFMKAGKCKPEMVQVLIDAGADARRYRYFLMLDALERKNMALVDYLEKIKI